MTNESTEPSVKTPAQITYNPVYRVTYEGADPTRGHVYNLSNPGNAQPATSREAVEIEDALSGWAQYDGIDPEAFGRWKHNAEQKHGHDKSGANCNTLRRLCNTIAHLAARTPAPAAGVERDLLHDAELRTAALQIVMRHRRELSGQQVVKEILALRAAQGRGSGS